VRVAALEMVYRYLRPSKLSKFSYEATFRPFALFSTISPYRSINIMIVVTQERNQASD
jgi:hypothetical protein